MLLLVERGATFNDFYICDNLKNKVISEIFNQKLHFLPDSDKKLIKYHHPYRKY